MPPVIDFDKCTKCGICTDVCAEDVFFRTNGFEKVEGEDPEISHPEVCFHCYLCVKECPTEAILLRTPMPMIVPYK